MRSLAKILDRIFKILISLIFFYLENVKNVKNVNIFYILLFLKRLER